MLLFLKPSGQVRALEWRRRVWRRRWSARRAGRQKPSVVVARQTREAQRLFLLIAVGAITHASSATRTMKRQCASSLR